MNKQELLKDYKNQEDKLLLAVILDKIEFCKSRNKIEYTDFLNLAEQDLADKFLKKTFDTHIIKNKTAEKQLIHKKNFSYISRKTYRRYG